ncbi:hypothetical protein [Streptomyces rhizosphaerihabitans]|nr:hypothetical protein [Streptomyces rhizosphaerihabitans]MCT9003504.1 hypothetical protein [Streptomyces rhizosphaerihabitans]
MESGNEDGVRTGEAADGEFENSPFGKWLAARAADGIRGTVGR